LISFRDLKLISRNTRGTLAKSIGRNLKERRYFARRVGGLSTHLKREAGECETQTQSEQRRYEDGEEHVAASSRESEAVAAEPPGAFGAPDPFRLADHVVPHHLRNDRVHARVKSILIAPRSRH